VPRPQVRIDRSPAARPQQAPVSPPAAAAPPTLGAEPSVSAPQPFVRPPEPVVIARSVPSPAASSARSHASAAPAPAEQTIARMPFVPAETGKTYETVVDELRRDLLRQRERMGDLLGDLPWA